MIDENNRISHQVNYFHYHYHEKIVYLFTEKYQFHDFRHICTQLSVFCPKCPKNIVGILLSPPETIQYTTRRSVIFHFLAKG